MNFVDAVKSGFQNYVTFSGRAARSQYWYWALFCILVGICSVVIDAALFPQSYMRPVNAIAELVLFCLPWQCRSDDCMISTAAAGGSCSSSFRSSAGSGFLCGSACEGPSDPTGSGRIGWMPRVLNTRSRLSRHATA